jgi:hypothetical protein
MKKRLTNRGFGIVEFKDANNNNCSLQTSSWIEPAIWLGQDKPTIVKDENGKDQYLCRMHLTPELVKELLPYLKRFIRSGRI